MKNLITLSDLSRESKKVINTILDTGMCKNVNCKIYSELCEKGYRNKLDLNFMENTDTLYSDTYFLNII